MNRLINMILRIILLRFNAFILITYKRQIKLITHVVVTTTGTVHRTVIVMPIVTIVRFVREGDNPVRLISYSTYYATERQRFNSKYLSQSPSRDRATRTTRQNNRAFTQRQAIRQAQNIRSRCIPNLAISKSFCEDVISIFRNRRSKTRIVRSCDFQIFTNSRISYLFSCISSYNITIFVSCQNNAFRKNILQFGLKKSILFIAHRIIILQRIFFQQIRSRNTNQSEICITNSYSTIAHSGEENSTRNITITISNYSHYERCASITNRYFLIESTIGKSYRCTINSHCCIRNNIASFCISDVTCDVILRSNRLIRLNNVHVLRIIAACNCHTHC